MGAQRLTNLRGGFGGDDRLCRCIVGGQPHHQPPARRPGFCGPVAVGTDGGCQRVRLLEREHHLRRRFPGRHTPGIECIGDARGGTVISLTRNQGGDEVVVRVGVLTSQPVLEQVHTHPVHEVVGCPTHHVRPAVEGEHRRCRGPELLQHPVVITTGGHAPGRVPLPVAELSFHHHPAGVDDVDEQVVVAHQPHSLGTQPVDRRRTVPVTDSRCLPQVV